VVHYAVRLVRATRVHEGENLDFVYEWVHRGAGPRAAHYLVLAAKARATLLGRSTATHDDVRAMSLPVLRHRIVINQNARINGIGVNRVIQRLVAEVPPRIVGDDAIPASGQSFTFHDWIPAAGDGQ
jgi:MoxR-like ATPase